MGEHLVEMLAATRARWPHLRLTVVGAGQRRMLQQLQQDQVDIVVALVPDKSEFEARHLWTEELAWVRGKGTAIDLKVPVPLVSYGDRCLCYSVAMATLEKAGLRGEQVFRANTTEALCSAVAANIGVMLLPRNRLPAGLQSWDDGPLPPAAGRLRWRIHARGSGERDARAACGSVRRYPASDVGAADTVRIAGCG